MPDLIKRLLPYRKALVAILGAALTAAAGFIAPGSTWGHLVAIALAALTAAGVYAVPNGLESLPTAVAKLAADKAKRQPS